MKSFRTSRAFQRPLLHLVASAGFCGATFAASPLTAAEANQNLIPETYDEVSQTAARSVSQPLLNGLKQLAKNDSGTVELIRLVKVLRDSGFSNKRATEAAPASSGAGRASSKAAIGRDQRGAGIGGSGGRNGRAQGADPSERFKSLDADGDGILTGGEIGPRMQGTPSAADNRVTLDEFKAAWEAMVASGSFGHSHGGGGHSHGGRSHGGGHREVIGRVEEPKNSDAEFLLLLDQNRDRNLTQEEILLGVGADIKANLAEIATLDVDLDGAISISEFTTRAAKSEPDSTEAPNSKTPPPINRRELAKFARMDLNTDKVLDPQELLESASASSRSRLAAIGICCALSAADADADGQIDASELSHAATITVEQESDRIALAVESFFEARENQALTWSKSYPSILELCNALVSRP